VSDVWAVLSARFRGLRSRARRDAVDHLAAGESNEVAANVSALYALRQAVDDAINDEVIRGRAIGVQWDLLGSTRQQAQQRHKRAMARRGKLRTRVHDMSTAVDEIRLRTGRFRQRPLTAGIPDGQPAGTELVRRAERLVTA
jgi:hypothetical protein